jgi:hypothetical protein
MYVVSIFSVHRLRSICSHIPGAMLCHNDTLFILSTRGPFNFVHPWLDCLVELGYCYALLGQSVTLRRIAITKGSSTTPLCQVLTASIRTGK